MVYTKVFKSSKNNLSYEVTVDYDEGCKVEVCNMDYNYIGGMSILNCPVSCGITELENVSGFIFYVSKVFTEKDIVEIFKYIIKSIRKHQAFITVSIVYKYSNKKEIDRPIAMRVMRKTARHVSRPIKNPNSKNKIVAIIF